MKLSINIAAGERCNFDCVYCFDKRVPKIQLEEKVFNPEAILTFVQNMSKQAEIENIWFSGGEPMLVKNFVETLSLLTKNGFFVGMNTNLTVNFDKLIAACDMTKVVLQPAIHFKELERHGMEQRWVNNYNKLIEAKTLALEDNVIAIAYPGLTEEEVFAFTDFYTNENGINFQFNPFMGHYEGKLYPESYTDEHNRIFNFTEFKEDHYKDVDSCHNSDCYAGVTNLVIQHDDNVYPCASIAFNKKINERYKMGNLYDGKVTLFPKCIKCPMKHCGCPIYHKGD